MWWFFHIKRQTLAATLSLEDNEPEWLIARSNFEAGLDEGDEGLVLAEGEDGLEQKDLGVTQLGVDLSFSPAREFKFGATGNAQSEKSPNDS